jgi:carboxyl-terminal processing protease
MISVPYFAARNPNVQATESMRRSKFPSRLALIGLSLFSASCALEEPPVGYNRQLGLYVEAMDMVRSHYVEPVAPDQLTEAALSGMLSSLDPHSSYMTEKQLRELRSDTQGEFGGIGLEVVMDNGQLRVVAPIDDTPAFRAGFQPGDLITRIDGQPTAEQTLAEAVERLRGTAGSKVAVTVQRGQKDEPFDLSLTRAVIRVQPVRHRVEKDIGIIRVTFFNEKAEESVERAIRDIRAKTGGKVRGYVLDLRNDPGGLLDQAIAVADIFLEKGEIVSTRGRMAEDNQRFPATSGDLTDGKPMVVLINSGSASASEIVAGALQDHKRATVLGTQSFGKGSVQTVFPLHGRGAGALRLTTARYYTPLGRSIQQVGITPDVEVPATRTAQADEAASVFRREADLRGALKNDTGAALPQASAVRPGGTGGTAVARPVPPGGLANEGGEDYQLERAMELLRAGQSGRVARTQ